MTTVAALYVASGGVYYGLPDVEPWGLPDRDARDYAGPWPIVAHPPCSRWCQLAFINQKRYGHKVGDDGGCFAAALNAVRAWGGVLEHPANSYAWAAFGLQRPKPGSWQHQYHRMLDSRHPQPWVTQVSQRAYGHRAIKRTWLYYVGDSQPPELDWSEPPPIAQVSFCKNHGNSPLPRLSKKEAAATPISFRDALLNLARHSRSMQAAA